MRIHWKWAVASRLWLAVCLWFVCGLAYCELAPKPESGEIGLVVAKLLEQHHYSGHPLDKTISHRFLRNYLNVLDYNHLIFLQSDIDAFAKYNDTLGDATLAANIEPAYEIYKRYSHRVEECVASVKDLLKEKFVFDGNDSIVLDRHEAPWPANEQEERNLLRQHLKYELLEERLNKEKPEEAVSIVSRRYERLARSVREADADSVLEIYLDSLTEAYDPHSQYLSPSSLDNFNINMKLSLTGIGAILRSEDGYAQITGIVPGGPADIDKRLKVNDRIAAVAQGDGPWVDVVDMKLNKVVELIRGEKGTVVRLKIITADAPDSSSRTEIKLVRDEIKLTEQEAKAKVIEQADANRKPLRLGYIDLPSFYVDMSRGPDAKSSTRDVMKLLARLNEKNVDGLIVDLRRNSGGSLAEVISLTGLFIQDGPVVQVKDPQGRVVVARDDNSGVYYHGPVVVLVSHFSASAAEIFAAAMQDYGRAVIVGDSNTFGKGTVQQIENLDPFVPLKNDKPGSTGALKLTIQKFYRISGGSTQERGVIPDIHLPSVLDAVRKIGEASLPNAMPYDEVKRADYKPYDEVAPYLGELRTHSAQRVEGNPDFQYIEQDIAGVKKQQDEKNVSLNQARRESEKKATTDRTEARKKERRARTPEPRTVIELTLENLQAKTNAVANVTSPALDKVVRNDGGGDAAHSADPGPDPDFDETLWILSDYVDLLAARPLTLQTAVPR